MTLNSNGLDQTQINSSNFVIIHNQRKKERSPPKKKKQEQERKNKRNVCGSTSDWFGPYNYEALQKLWKPHRTTQSRTQKKEKEKDSEKRTR